MNTFFKYAIVMTFCLAMAAPTFADFTAVMDDQAIVMTPVNANCVGNGIPRIDVSRNSFIRYAATQNCAGMTNDAGQGMYVTVQSGKGTNSENLQFVVMANQTAGQPDDNNIYQIATGAVATAVPAAVTTLSSFVVRGTTTVMP